MDSAQQAAERGPLVVLNMAEHERIPEPAGAHAPRDLTAIGFAQGLHGVPSPADGRLWAACREVDSGGVLHGPGRQFQQEPGSTVQFGALLLGYDAQRLQGMMRGGVAGSQGQTAEV